MRFDHFEHARTWVNTFNLRAQLGQIGETAEVPLSQAALEFLAGCSALAAGTRVHYGSALGFLRGVIGDKPVKTIRGQDIDRFVALRMSSSKPATVKKHVAGLHRFFTWCIEHNYADQNPVKLATSRPKGSYERDRPAVSDEALDRLVAALDTDDRRLAVAIALTTGLDRGMIQRLTPEQIDLENQVIRFTRGKTKKHLTVPLHASLLPALRPRLARTPVQQPILSGLSRQHRASDWWEQARQAAGLPTLLFRDLRALATHRLMRAGATLRQAQDLLGHASPTTTMRHYQMPEPDLIHRLNARPVPGFPAAPESTAAPPGSADRPACETNGAYPPGSS
jgi:integrase